MATTYWVGTTGDFNSAPNWSNGVPSAISDVAIADGRSQQSMTTNLDRTVAAFRLITTPEYEGDIGASGNELKWEGAGTSNEHVIRGSGSVYVDTLSTSACFVVDSSNLVNALTIKTGVVNVYIKRGHVTVANSCQLSGDLILCDQYASCAVGTLGAAATWTHIIMQAGSLTVDRQIEAATKVIISGGEMTMTKLFALNHISVYMLGGLLVYTPTTKTANSTRFIIGGRLDASANSENIISNGLLMLPSGEFFREQQNRTTLDTDLRDDYP